MERIAKTTALKGDLLLELKEIRLAINKTNNELEIVQREKKSLSLLCSKVNDELKEREAACARIKDKFNSDVGDSKIYLKNIDDKVLDVSSVLRDLKKKEEKLKSNIDETEKTFSEKKKNLNKQVVEIELNIEKLNNEFSLTTDKISSLNKIALQLEDKNKSETKRQYDRSLELSKKEKNIEEMQKELERTRSDLRVWSVRLNKKYGLHMAETEKKIISIIT